jgi:hydrogenase nickel incorporation protein HypA/HybF
LQYHGCRSSQAQLSGVESPLLARAFEIARFGTLAKQAGLDIEIVPVVVWCDRCETSSQVPANALLCADCGTWDVVLTSGNELLLERVDLITGPTPLVHARAQEDRHV